jgi:pyruvate carboxylase
MSVLSHPEFEKGAVPTSFIDKNPGLKQTSQSMWDFASEEQADSKKTYASKRLIRYLANIAVNGQPQELGADPTKLAAASATKSIPVPVMSAEEKTAALAKTPGWRQVLLESGPEGFAKAVRDHKGLLLTDTTLRDAHQSLLATRMRTQEVRRRRVCVFVKCVATV